MLLLIDDKQKTSVFWRQPLFQREATHGTMKEVPLPNNGTVEEEGKRPTTEKWKNKATLSTTS